MSLTPLMMETLIAAAGMTAYTDDCDRIVLAKRALPPTIEPTFVLDSDLPPF